MNTQPNLGHSIIPQPIGHLPDDIGCVELKVVETTSANIRGILDNASQLQLMHKQNKFNSLLGKIALEIKNIRNICNYHYEQGDYTNRLNSDDLLLELTFSQLLDTFPELKSDFIELQSICDGFPLGILVLERVKKEYFQDLIYEFIDSKGVNSQEMSSTAIRLNWGLNSTQNLFSYIENMNIKCLLFCQDEEISITNEDREKLFHIFKQIPQSGLTKIDFDDLDINILFDNTPEQLIELIGFLNGSSVKCLTFRSVLLSSLFQDNVDIFTSFIHAIGTSGIKYLDLYCNNLYNTFLNNRSEFINFIKVAGENGLKSINLSLTNLYSIFESDSDSLIQCVKVAGLSGIKYLDLSQNALCKIFVNNISDIFELVRVAGESGILYLDISSNALSQVFGVTDKDIGKHKKEIKQFIEFCRDSGLTGINIKDNGFETLNLGWFYDVKNIINDLQKL